MVLRAMFGGALVICPDRPGRHVYMIVGLRWMQGMLTGSVAASAALCATVAPRNRMPFSIGMIMVAIFIGGSLGPFLGGFVADHLGYRVTFLHFVRHSAHQWAGGAHPGQGEFRASPAGRGSLAAEHFPSGEVAARCCRS